MKRELILLICLILFLVSFVSAETNETAYFKIAQMICGNVSEGCWIDDTYSLTIKLTDQEKIDHAREIIQYNGSFPDGGIDYESNVLGKVIKEPADYNLGWSFHLEPSTIDFWDLAIMQCQWPPIVIENNLPDNICTGTILGPDCILCWGTPFEEVIIECSVDDDCSEEQVCPDGSTYHEIGCHNNICELIAFPGGSPCGLDFADNNKDGVIEISELINYIVQWKSGSVTISQLIDAIGKWKNGC